MTSSVSSGRTSPVGRRRNRIWRFGKSGTVLKLPKGPNPWEHLSMTPEDDPEERIRQLEKENARLKRMVAEQALGSDQGRKYVYVVNDKDEVEDSLRSQE